MRLRWRRLRSTGAPPEVRVQVESIQTLLPAGGGDPSPVFGLWRGETRRIVIDGVPFDATRDREEPAS